MREMRDAHRFWNRASAQCETPVAFWNREGAKCETPVALESCRREMRTLVAFGIVQERNARRPSLFSYHASAQCEMLVVFGVVQTRNARLFSVLHG